MGFMKKRRGRKRKKEKKKEEKRPRKKEVQNGDTEEDEEGVQGQKKCLFLMQEQGLEKLICLQDCYISHYF